MLFWNKICGFLLIFFNLTLSASAQKINSDKSLAHQLPANQFIKSINISVNKEEIPITQPFSAIPENYYTQHFGIMCKQELAIEKATKIPFRFRLGSLQQCNYLEGKK